MSKKIVLKELTSIAMLIALQIIFERFLSIGGTQTWRISFGFLPICIAAMLFGPIKGGITAAAADVVGMLINSSSGVYFFPFTISQFLNGFGYGLYTHRRPHSYLKTTLFVIVQFVCINLLLTTFWNYLYCAYILGTPKAFWVIMSGRLVTAAFNLPVQIILVNLSVKYLRPPLGKVIKQ